MKFIAERHKLGKIAMQVVATFFFFVLHNYERHEGRVMRDEKLQGGMRHAGLSHMVQYE